MAALCPSNRRLLLLWPWRISGSCTDIIRSRLTPSLRLTPSSPSPLLRSMSWSSNCPSNSAPANYLLALSAVLRQLPLRLPRQLQQPVRVGHNLGQQRRPGPFVAPVDGGLAFHAGTQVSMVSLTLRPLSRR